MLPRKFPRYVLPFFGIGFSAFLAFSLFSGLKKGRSVGSNYLSPQKAMVEIKSLSFVQTETGALSMALDAAGAVISENGQKSVLKKVAVTIPYGNDSELKLKGDEGVIDAGKKEFSLWKKTGLMTVELENGYTLRTSGLKWSEAQGQIVSQGPAYISGSHVKIDGNSLKISVENQEMTVIGDVKALVN